MKRKIFAFMLSFIICSTVLSACNSESNPTNTDIVTQPTMTVETTQAELTDKVPELDFDGSEFNILLRTHVKYEFVSEGETGEVVNDAIYRRNMKIQERFNIKFNMIDVAGTWDAQSTFLGKIKSSISAGDNAYDLIAGYAAYIANLTEGGYYYNWNEVPYIDFEAPWWNQVMIDELNINSKLYFMTGDLALSTLWNAVCLYYNKDMWASYGFENPYTIVNEGKWTLDKMAEFTKQAYKDVDGDGAYSEGDQYGYVTDTHNLVDAYQAALDVPVTVKGSDGLPQLNLQNEKFFNAFAKLYDYLRKESSTYTGIEQTGSPESLYRPFFEQGRALIMPEYLGNSSLMRNYSFDFGILPLPKYDESQANYQTISQDGFSLFCIPSTVVDTNMVGAVTEAMAYETYKSVVPAFYDVALKTKYTRDDDSSEMIDIIRSNMIYNFNTVYAVSLGVPAHLWRILLIEKRDNLVSDVEKKMNVFQSNLDKVISLYN
ncbi:MAG: ABC transporter substrate-binding protein [Eubacteriales bacterium]